MFNPKNKTTEKPEKYKKKQCTHTFSLTVTRK